jgi:hypothetical protein
MARLRHETRNAYRILEDDVFKGRDRSEKKALRTVLGKSVGCRRVG